MRSTPTRAKSKKSVLRDSRLSFTRKVYATVGLQLYFTAAVILWFDQNKSVLYELMRSGVVYASSLIGLGLILAFQVTYSALVLLVINNDDY